MSPSKEASPPTVRVPLGIRRSGRLRKLPVVRICVQHSNSYIMIYIYIYIYIEREREMDGRLRRLPVVIYYDILYHITYLYYIMRISLLE
jgi:hypothetical protein